MESRDRIAGLLVEKYGVDEDRLTQDATLADLGLDSLSVLELVFDIEDLFEIEMDVENVEFETFGEAVTVVDRHLEAGDA